MLQIALIRQHADMVINRLKLKNYSEAESIVNAILGVDKDFREHKKQLDDVLAKNNSLSKEIGELFRQKKTDEANEKKKEVENLKMEEGDLKTKLTDIEKTLEEYILRLPNLPSEQVPPGKTPEDNVNIREGGAKPKLPAGAVPHWDLAKKYNLIDFELGNKITGSGFPVYIGKGAKLQRSLIQYFLDYNTAAGYTEYLPPFMVNETSAFGTGQLPDKEGQMYYVTADEFYLIPTAEVPVTNIYRDVMLKENDLPVKMTAYTPCFRREAGSYGKDVRGLNRLHQFDKVEIVQIAHPDKSYEVLEEMVNHIEKLVQSLGLPYRILKLCGGDMGFASALTYDFEVYSAAQEKWLEVSSVSNFETYQSNRMKMRFKDKDGKNQLVHTLNGSSLALPRILACLLENNQHEKGIQIPAVLQRYFGDSDIQ
jgi:seryl-tRNA synthetase